jgi:hypothetical protein
MLSMISRVLRTRDTIRLSAAVLLAAALLTSTPTSASPIALIGEATGCFGAGCNTFTDIASDDTFGLTFEGMNPFEVTTDDGDVVSFFLGTFTRDNVNVSSELEPLPFALQVKFSSPNAQDGTFVASIAGWSPGGGGPLTIDFSPGWQAVSFVGEQGLETVEFRIVNDRWLTKNGQSHLIGEVRNLDVDGAIGHQLIVTPEPATLFLFGSGLAITAWSARRANTRRRRVLKSSSSF